MRDRAPLGIEHERQPGRGQHRFRLKQDARQESVEHRDIERVAVLGHRLQQFVELAHFGIGQRRRQRLGLRVRVHPRMIERNIGAGIGPPLPG
jgi:hypothetical protein